LLLVIQIEHARAVENLEEIITVEGIDVVFIGANDLSASMGLLGQPVHPLVLKAIERIRDVATEHGVTVGLNAGTAEAVNQRFAEGFHFVGINYDVGFLHCACQSVCRDIQRKIVIQKA